MFMKDTIDGTVQRAIEDSNGKRIDSYISSVVGSGNIIATPDSTGRIVVSERTCRVGQSGGTATNPYYMVASLTFNKVNHDRRITFRVSKGHGDKAEGCGILTAYVGTSSVIGKISSCELVWEYANSYIETSKFFLLYKENSGVSLDVQLWVKVDVSYKHYLFSVLSETDHRDFETSIWSLYNKSSAGSEASLPSGYTVIESRLGTLLNPTSGNASTATKLETPRTISIGSSTKNFDGSENLSYSLAEMGAVAVTNGAKTGLVDWNTLDTAGCYKINKCTMTSECNAPVNEYGYGVLQVIASQLTGENRTVQIYYPHQPVSYKYDMWMRMCNGGVWTSWKGTYSSNAIESNFIKSITASGKVITLTRGNETTETLTTQDTTYGAATSSTLGLVKSGTDITVDANGNVSVVDDSHNHTVANVDGLQSSLDGKLALSGGSLTGLLQTQENSLPLNNSKSSSMLQIKGNKDNGAYMSFYKPGLYGVNLGMGANTNEVSIGGWSMGNVQYPVIHTGNIDAYIKPLIKRMYDANVSNSSSLDFLKDCNSAEIGKMCIYSNSTLNAPVSRYGCLFTFGYYREGDPHATWLYQFATDTRLGNSYTRMNVNNTGWTAWIKNLTTIDIKGAGNISATPDSNGDITISERTCRIGQSSGSTANPYYLIASTTLNTPYHDRRISFRVGMGQEDKAQGSGILTAHIRTGSTGDKVDPYNGCELVWEYANSYIDTSKFFILYKENSGVSIECQLWAKIDRPFRHYFFNVIKENSHSDFESSTWNLYSKRSATGSEASLPSGYTVTESELGTLLNATAGNASTATKLQTPRKINGVEFDGSNNISVPPVAKLLTNEDLNNFKGESNLGFWYAMGGNTIKNKPASIDAFGLIVMRTANGLYAQIVYCNSGGMVYKRQVDGNSLNWTAWSVMATDRNVDSYIYSLSTNGKNLTYTKGDGTTGTLTTQDTVYTHPAISGNKHIPAGGAANQILMWNADGTASWGNFYDIGVTTISKTLTLTTAWQDTGITGSGFTAGSYVVQLSGMASASTGLYSEIFTGYMSWEPQATNDSNISSEIVFHSTGHSTSSGNTIYLRTIRTAGGTSTCKLQIACKVVIKPPSGTATSFGASNYTFKFKRLI